VTIHVYTAVLTTPARSNARYQQLGIFQNSVLSGDLKRRIEQFSFDTTQFTDAHVDSMRLRSVVGLHFLFDPLNQR